MTGIPKGGKEISVKILLLTRLYRQNDCNGLTDFSVLLKNNDFSDFAGRTLGTYGDTVACSRQNPSFPILANSVSFTGR